MKWMSPLLECPVNSTLMMRKRKLKEEVGAPFKDTLNRKMLKYSNQNLQVLDFNQYQAPPAPTVASMTLPPW